MKYNRTRKKYKGAGKCKICGSLGATAATCPLNPKAKNPNPIKHPNARQVKTPTPDRSFDFLKMFNSDNIVDIDAHFTDNHKEWSILIDYKHNKDTIQFVVTFDKLLGEGAYGRVYKVKIVEKYSDNEYDLALKVDKGDSEYKLSKDLFMKCDTIQNRFFYKSDPYYVYFMTLADGDLSDYKAKFISKMSHKKAHQHILSIVDEIRKQMLCLLDNGYIYTDMKPENCLYKFVNDKPKFIIGDIGGAAMDDTGEQASTYIPIELIGEGTGWSDTKNMTLKAKDDFLSWEIGILLYTLSPKVKDDSKCKFNTPHFLYYSNPCDKKYDKLLERAQINLASWYGPTYSNYLNPTPSKRPSLDDKLIPS